MKIRILIVDDHAALRASLRTVIEKSPDIMIVGEAADGRQALALAEKLRPDIIVLDCRLPKMTGPAVADAVRAMQLPTRILALSAYADMQFVHSMLHTGAAGYLLKDEAREKIIEAVMAIAHGMTWYSQSILAMLHLENGIDTSQPQISLTPTEIAILQCMARGWDEKRIAADLGAQKTTVEEHIETIYKKLDVHTRARAVSLAWELGLIA